METKNIDTAFEIVVKEIDALINHCAEASANASTAHNFPTARQMADRAELITTFRNNVSTIRTEWAALEASLFNPPSEKSLPTKAKLSGRLSRGVRTPERAYYLPILILIVESNGTAQAARVLKNLPEKMRGILKDADFRPMSSSRGEPRWRNAARWARNTMVQDGRLKSRSPRGFWEITEQGMDYLKTSQSEQGGT